MSLTLTYVTFTYVRLLAHQRRPLVAKTSLRVVEHLGQLVLVIWVAGMIQICAVANLVAAVLGHLELVIDKGVRIGGVRIDLCHLAPVRVHPIVLHHVLANLAHGQIVFVAILGTLFI